MKPLFTQLKLATVSLILLSSPAVIACEIASSDRNPSHSARYSGIINAGFEDFLIRSGQSLLQQLGSDKPIDHKNSTLFKETMVHLDPVKEKAKYSITSDWALVSNFVRKWNASTDQDYITSRKNHLAAILSICWALTQQADDQKDYFKRGSFTLIDPGHKLYNFFLDYVKLVTGNDNPQSVPFLKEVSNFAYQRNPQNGESSHHVDRSPESQFGVDMRLEPNDGVLMILPHSATHVLFGKLDVGGQETPLTFVKFEEIGMGSKGAILAHSASLHRSLQHVEDEARREKDIRPELSLSFELMRVMAKMAKVQVPDNLKTIRSMTLVAREHAEKSDTPGAFEAREFLRRLEVNYPGGHHDLRTGNEVIIDLSSFLNVSKK